MHCFLVLYPGFPRLFDMLMIPFWLSLSGLCSPKRISSSIQSQGSRYTPKICASFSKQGEPYVGTGPGFFFLFEEAREYSAGMHGLLV